MSGHSKWSTIKRQKGVTDAKRGAAFTKAANVITVAAREGGENPESNFKLRLAIEEAKKLNMPRENIERAIKRGTGSDKNNTEIYTMFYEGFGPDGVGIYIEALTDNKMRTAAEIRSTLERNNGRLSGSGSVEFLFQPVGEIVIKKTPEKNEEDIFLVAADAGASDFESSESEITITCAVSSLELLKDALTKENLEIVLAKISKKPKNVIKITDENKASSLLSLINKLDDLQDVKEVYSNFDIPEDIILKISET